MHYVSIIVLLLQSILYSDYIEEKRKWEEEMRAKTEEKKAVELARDQDAARLLEFEVGVCEWNGDVGSDSDDVNDDDDNSAIVMMAIIIHNK